MQLTLSLGRQLTSNTRLTFVRSFAGPSVVAVIVAAAATTVLLLARFIVISVMNANFKIVLLAVVQKMLDNFLFFSFSFLVLQAFNLKHFDGI